MCKTKNEGKRNISSFFTSNKPYTRIQKKTKATIATGKNIASSIHTGQNIASRTRLSIGGQDVTSRTQLVTEGQSVTSKTRQESKASKSFLKPINGTNKVKKPKTRKSSKLEQKPNATLDSFIVKGKTTTKNKDELHKENTLVKHAPTFKRPSRSDTARRRRELIERVRAKGQKTLEETLQGMDLVKKKQKAMLSRALEIANSLSFLYLSRNKTVMFVKEAAARIIESSNVPISEREAIEHLELLTKIAPKWCQFSTNKDKNDLLIIDTSMSTWEVREIVEERTKNFQ